MGLIGTMINALYLGGTLYHWPTASFLRSPGRYLQLVGELGVTMTVAPPFALQLVTRRQERRPSTVDLSGLRSILVGAELIRPEVLTAFTAAFAPYGLAPAAVTPSYGLAEATVGVTAMACDEPVPGGRPRTARRGVVRLAAPGRGGRLHRIGRGGGAQPGADGRLPRRSGRHRSGRSSTAGSAPATPGCSSTASSWCSGGPRR